MIKDMDKTVCLADETDAASMLIQGMIAAIGKRNPIKNKEGHMSQTDWRTDAIAP